MTTPKPEAGIEREPFGNQIARTWCKTPDDFYECAAAIEAFAASRFQDGFNAAIERAIQIIEAQDGMTGWKRRIISALRSEHRAVSKDAEPTELVRELAQSLRDMLDSVFVSPEKPLVASLEKAIAVLARAKAAGAIP